jgi:chromosome partitioning protein
MMTRVDTRLFREETFEQRIGRRFTKRQVAKFLSVEVSFLAYGASADPDIFPEGRKSGREVTFSPDEISLMRAILGSKPRLKKPYLHWRKPGDPLPVISFGALKGGTGKTMTTAHFAQYLSLTYGLRVGVIDSDPQATCSLYFAGAEVDAFSGTTRTIIDFMGITELDGNPPTLPPSSDQDAMWQRTPWPGVRIIPGGMDVMNGDIALMRMMENRHRGIYGSLRNAIDKWSLGNQPQTLASDLRRVDGSFDQEAYQAALYETLDVIVIDQQPSMTILQMCGPMAADSLIIPMTMKGFDLSTLSIYAASLASYMDVISEDDPAFRFGELDHFVLPTIVQTENDKDLSQIADLRAHGGDMIAPVWYDSSVGVPNAVEKYMSIYEYDAPKSRRSSTKTFSENANAVNDYIVGRVLPHLPSRGFADQFIADRVGE